MKAGLRVASVLALCLLCTACAGGQSAFGGGGEQASKLAWLMMFIMIVCGVVWIAVMAALAFALWRRRRHLSSSPVSLDSQRQRRMGAVVGAAVALTVMIICGFTLMSYRVTTDLWAAERDAVQIDVRGYQWWWKITYRDSDPTQSFTTANEIHVPVGRLIRIKLDADDVIHSFWVPSLTGKQDLIPGRTNETSFVVERQGVYRGQCAEFCGLQHARMAMLVIAESAEDYERWRSAQVQPAPPPSGPEQQAGAQVFISKACAGCHAVRGTGATGSVGPDLTHVAARRTLAAGVLETTRGSFAAWIADPQTIKPGNNMPMVSLSADELNALSAYMTALK
jgi:cytochrome c oxidase subunit 2